MVKAWCGVPEQAGGGQLVGEGDTYNTFNNKE